VKKKPRNRKKREKETRKIFIAPLGMIPEYRHSQSLEFHEDGAMEKIRSMVVGLDIDGTITVAGEFFRMLTAAVYREGGKVIIVSARSDTRLARKETEAVLWEMGILYSKLILLPEGERMLGVPPSELGYLERFLWQKVHICLAENVSVFFDDDDVVVDLFARYAPGVQVYQSMTRMQWL